MFVSCLLVCNIYILTSLKRRRRRFHRRLSRRVAILSRERSRGSLARFLFLFLLVFLAASSSSSSVDRRRERTRVARVPLPLPPPLALRRPPPPPPPSILEKGRELGQVRSRDVLFTSRDSSCRSVFQLLLTFADFPEAAEPT